MKIKSNVGPGDDDKKKKPASAKATQDDSRTIYSIDNRADMHSKAHTIKMGAQQAKKNFKTGPTDYAGNSAPRVGGKATATQGGVPTVSSKKLIKISKRNVNKSAASSQAKRSARKLY